MGIDAKKLAQRVEELTLAHRQLQEKFGSPGYNPNLVELLHEDLNALKAQLNEHLSSEISLT